MIICHCGVVNDRTVVAAIQAGARSLSQVCRTTGAGQTCGDCIFSVKQLLCQHEPVGTTPALEVARAAG
jgi:bacterioferritin-associated ferredoxin